MKTLKLLGWFVVGVCALIVAPRVWSGRVRRVMERQHLPPGTDRRLLDIPRSKR